MWLVNQVTIVKHEEFRPSKFKYAADLKMIKSTYRVPQSGSIKELWDPQSGSAVEQLDQEWDP